MLEMKDPAMKLFGKTICLPVRRDVLLDEPSRGAGRVSGSEAGDPRSRVYSDSVSANFASQEERDGREAEEAYGDKTLSEREPANDKYGQGTSWRVMDNPKDSTDSSSINQKNEIGRETSPPTSTNKGENEMSISQEMVPKKPDKILPCPRCNSTDTKFCYYNNYNLNQPRHLCRNCQRYWTAGGTMRNIPVGAGRRKGKNSYAAAVAPFHHMGVPESLRADCAGNLKNAQTTVLKFGSDSPNCGQSAALVPITMTGFPDPGRVIPSSVRGVDSFSDELLSGSSLTASNSMEKASDCYTPKPPVRNYQGFPWGSVHWNSIPALCNPGFPVSFYQAPQCYWAYALPGSLNATPNIASLLPASLSHNSIASPPSPPSMTKLGKHSRDRNVSNPGNGTWTWEEDCGGPTKKSIIRASEALDRTSESGELDHLPYGAFRSTGKGKSFNDRRTLLLQANPAAMCRSMNFDEST